MLLYQFVLKEAAEKGLDQDREAAKFWLAEALYRRHGDETELVGWRIETREDGTEQWVVAFPWGDRDWLDWQAYLWCIRKLDGDTREYRDFDSPALAHANTLIGFTRNTVWATHPRDVQE